MFNIILKMFLSLFIWLNQSKANFSCRGILKQIFLVRGTCTQKKGFSLGWKTFSNLFVCPDNGLKQQLKQWFTNFFGSRPIKRSYVKFLAEHISLANLDFLEKLGKTQFKMFLKLSKFRGTHVEKNWVRVMNNSAVDIELHQNMNSNNNQDDLKNKSLKSSWASFWVF